MKTFQELKRLTKHIPEGLPTIKVALLGDSATQLLGTAIRGMGVERGFCIDLWEADYNQVERQILDPTSGYHQFGADYTIIFQSTHKLLEKYSLATQTEREALCDDRIAFIEEALRACSGHIVCFNYPETDDCVFGSYTNKLSSSFLYQVRKLNFCLMELARQHASLHICDTAALQSKFGRDKMFDANIYISTEMLLSLDILPFVASRVMDVLCSLCGRFKKCLVLDLDNTLWGGIVGDDGWENVQIGHGLGIGKAFTEFQEWIKKLKERGIILAVCSKNDERNAKEVFEKNPEMVLKVDDIAVFMANWDNKVDNIRRIQSILNIGMDSLVFLDDNPFERNMVREHIPEITVPELPEDPADYLEYLYGENLFETASFSALDADRTRQYQAEAQREMTKTSFTNEEDFLKSLSMEATVEGFTAFNIPRVAQLSQRSNQFNLRTVRYTESEVSAMATDNDYACFSFSLSDKFGENGLICVVILKKMNAETLFVDTWFMSCRVLKRGMEHFTLNTIVDYAKANGYKRIIGEYLPTAKNKMVEHHYESLGFTRMEGGDTARYELPVDGYEALTCYIATKQIFIQ